LAAGLQDQDLVFRPLAQPIGQHAAGRPGPDDDVIVACSVDHEPALAARFLSYDACLVQPALAARKMDAARGYSSAPSSTRRRNRSKSGMTSVLGLRRSRMRCCSSQFISRLTVSRVVATREAIWLSFGAGNSTALRYSVSDGFAMRS